MDLNIQEEIQFEALSIYSKNHHNARKRLVYIQDKLNQPRTDINETAKLHANLDSAMKQYNSIRIQQNSKKYNTIISLSNKYPSLNQNYIRQTLDDALRECESVNNELFEINSDGIIVEYIAPITIPVYTKPSRTDMAVLLVYFNACEYKKLAQNMLLTYQTLLRSDIPVFLVEHCFKDQVPLFKENGSTIFNTRSDSYMFYKENLINWLMPKIPEQYTKFYMMDCDLIFENESWYDDISVLLDTHDIVQPFQTAIWLDSDLKSSVLKRDSFTYAVIENKPYSLELTHPGFAWAARRDFIQSIGLFDINILGSGDTIFSSSVLQLEYNNIEGLWIKYMNWSLPYYTDYYKRFDKVRVIYYSQNIYHLWHGSKLNRSYNTRYADFNVICNKYNIKTKETIFELNSYGIYEYKSEYREEFNNLLLNYFKSRNEDGI